MRVLIDTDVILNVVQNRQPFSLEANQIWNANRLKLFDGYVAVITPINVFYIVRKQSGLSQAQQAVQTILANFQVCPVDYAILEAARLSVIADFEDAVQHESALASGLDMIVTRNLSDYKGATLKVLPPASFLSQLPPSSPMGNTP